jgi:hypothetical protein
MTSHRARTGRFVVALAALTLAACSSGTSAAPPSTQAPVTTTTAAPSQSAGQAPTASSGSCGSSGTRVGSASDLKSALASARPGETIVLAPGLYQGDFKAVTSGTAGAPITLCGPRSAVLQGDSTKSGYTFYLDHASYWRVEGFTVEGGQKGVMTDGADYVLVTGLYVHGTGDEAIHLRDFSSNDTVSHNVVSDTGLLEAFFGEGIYVGSAHSNWCKYSGCQPDASDHDVITGNDISNTTAENIEVKEGTTGGTITGNHLDGTGMVSSAATSWINVKGNDWTIAGNTGVDSIGNGFSVHQVYPGWGLGNVFRANQITVNGPGYGIYVQSKRLNTLVACDNTVSGAQSGFSTITCSSA